MKNKIINFIVKKGKGKNEQTDSLLVGLSMLLFTFILVGLMITFIGKNPFIAFGALLRGAFGSKSALIHTIVKSIPVALCSLTVLISLRGGTFNIGAEGQLLMGASAAAIVGIYGANLPPFFHVMVCIVAGMAAGMLWCLIPALLYVKKGISLLVIFLLLNTIANFLLQYFVLDIFRNPDSLMPSTKRIANSAKLPNLIGGPVNLSIGVLITIAVAIILFIIIKKSNFGYELQATGYNRNAARVSGIKINKYLFLSLMLGGLFAGLGGALEILGNHYALYTDFSPGYGYDGIPIALLSGGNPIIALLGSLFFGALRAGSINMRAVSGVSGEIIDIIQGLLIMLIGTRQIFKYLIFKVKKAKIKEESV